MRMGFVLLVALPILASSAKSRAANIDYVQPGQNYYLLYSDDSTEVVRVTAVDKRSGSVQVVDSNGVADWLHPQLLLTRRQVEQSLKRKQDQEDRDTMEFFFGLACVIAPKTCKN